ncbi:MAG TPA: BolA/IbaG family iron-sulfur metabolism protein, partial [Burkholderiaceae bacterium]|nr:BolA/IbaG family iron-sulfur metabolism protein [Burkholderiaceae bacterium]
MAATPLRDAMMQALIERLEPLVLELVDDSAAHAGHAGAREGAHFNLRIVS